MSGGILFVDDDVDNVEAVRRFLRETSGRVVAIAESVEDAVDRLHQGEWALVVMDLFLPLGEHPHRLLGPRARKYQEHVDHLGGLVLLEEIGRMSPKPRVASHTACTDHVLLDLFGDAVEHRIPKPSPLDTLLHGINEALESLGERG